MCRAFAPPIFRNPPLSQFHIKPRELPPDAFSEVWRLGLLAGSITAELVLLLLGMKPFVSHGHFVPTYAVLRPLC